MLHCFRDGATGGLGAGAPRDFNEPQGRGGYSPPSERNDQFIGAHFKTILSSSNLLSIRNHVLIKIVIATQC